MYNSQIYQQGIHGVLIVKWRLRCETPLVVRNGLSIQYTEETRPNSKERGLGLAFQWQAPSSSKSDHEVATLHYGYEVVNGTVRAYHFVPSSSVRGALRSWTLRTLTLPEYAGALVPPDDTNKEKMTDYLNRLLAALGQSDSGFPLVASLFGIATNQDEHDEAIANAGRLLVEAYRFPEDVKPIPITATGIVKGGEVGPGNAARQMTVRNPLDRITHASRDGGLHHFLEFSRGQSFNVQLVIRNPQASDLGLLSLWQREMDDGLLRLGALSSVGRGRVKVVEAGYRLWQRANAPAFQGMDKFIAEESESQDILAGLWQSHTLPTQSLSQFEQYVFTQA